MFMRTLFPSISLSDISPNLLTPHTSSFQMCLPLWNIILVFPSRVQIALDSCVSGPHSKVCCSLLLHIVCLLCVRVVTHPSFVCIMDISPLRRWESLALCFSTCGPWPLGGANDLFPGLIQDHLKTQIFTSQLITVTKLQLWHSNISHFVLESPQLYIKELLHSKVASLCVTVLRDWLFCDGCFYISFI